MKLLDVKDPAKVAEFEEKGYQLPKYDREAVKKATAEAPTWIHFGAGNIFRAYQASILEDALNAGKYDKGVIVAEGYDFEIIDRAYQPYDNLSLSVVMYSTGDIEKKVIGCMTESLKADSSFPEDWERLKEIFRNPSLQMVSFSITEKGYGFTPDDLRRGLDAKLMMGKITALLYERYLAGEAPITLSSMDNCSHNGDAVKNAVYAYTDAWVASSVTPPEFMEYIKRGTKVSYPWSMIDKITPRPDAKVRELLEADGFEDTGVIETAKHSFTAPFVNAEEVGYLVIEDDFKNGRPPLELGGAIFTDRETVDKVERMKVGTCLNPLHTAMGTFGCMMGFTLVSAEMKDEDINAFVRKIGYDEGMPVVVNPGIIDPMVFIGECLNKRFPNPFMPDAPQRLVMDNSQKIPVRFGGTIKEYLKRGEDLNKLTYIPLVFAGYARYLKGIDDWGQPFTPTSDPLLAELQAIVAPLEVKEGEQDFSVLEKLFRRADIFGADLVEEGLYEKVVGMTKELYAGPGAIRSTLHKYVATQ